MNVLNMAKESLADYLHELMQLEKSNIKVADYLTKLPDMKLLEDKLRQSYHCLKAKK
jgi:hypothetical protein